MSFYKITTAAAVAFGLTAAPVLAQAADPAPEAGAPGGAGAEMQAGTFTDETLQAFVTAALDVQEVRAEYEGRIAEAADDDAAATLATEARDAMVQAVEDADDITVEEYLAVGSAAEADPLLAERLTAMFQAQQRGDTSGS